MEPLLIFSYIPLYDQHILRNSTSFIIFLPTNYGMSSFCPRISAGKFISISLYPRFHVLFACCIYLKMGGCLFDFVLATNLKLLFKALKLKDM